MRRPAGHVRREAQSTLPPVAVLEGMTDGTMTSGGVAGALSGRSGWLICDGKAGMVVQVRGVADALGLDYEMKTVAPRGLHRILSPWGPVHPSERAGAPGSPLLTPPWPEIVIATGRASIPYLREVRRHAGPSCFTVVLQDPKTPASHGRSDLGAAA